MPKPVKFDLMRANREVAACRIYYERAVAVAPAEPAPAVPTMDVDGALYREAPEVNECDDCSFYEADCFGTIEAAARRAFGGPCSARNVIYIRAE
jgi:hypothetical protein